MRTYLIRFYTGNEPVGRKVIEGESLEAAIERARQLCAERGAGSATTKAVAR